MPWIFYDSSGRRLSTTVIADNAVTLAKMAANSVDSDQYVDGSIDGVHIANDAIDSQHYAAGSIDLEHMSSQSVDEDNLYISNAGSNGEFLSKQSGNAGGLTWAAAGGGKIGQIVSVTKQDTFTTTSASFVDITGLTVDITPTATSSKVLVHFSVVGSQDVGVQRASYVLLRDSTAISVGTAVGSRTGISGEFASSHESILNGPTGGVYLDSPSSTSALTYKIQARSEGTAFINRTDSYGDAANTGNFASTIVLMEVLA